MLAEEVTALVELHCSGFSGRRDGQVVPNLKQLPYGIQFPCFASATYRDPSSIYFLCS
jgi:hypothetical protein